MKILVSGWGSTGDVLPGIAVGWELRRRGHEVRFVGNPYHERHVRAAGMEMVPVGLASDHERMMADNHLFDAGRKSAEDIFAEHYYHNMRPFFDAASEAFDWGASVMVGAEIGSVSAAERHDVPWFKMAPSPGAGASLGSKRDWLHPEWMLPRGLRWLANTPRGMALYYQLWLLRRGRLTWPTSTTSETFETGPIADFRRPLGLSPSVKYQPRAMLCMWPDWFAPWQPDWPSHAKICGFPLFPRPVPAPARAPGAARGPVVVTSGTMASSQHEFYAKAVQACRSLGLEAVLVTPHRDNVPAVLPPGVRHLAHAPFEELIGQASLVIHHGGVGTAAYALAAGVPQLAMPMRGDQFDNANRVQRLGVGRLMSSREHRAEDLAQAMRQLLGPAVARRCRHWQQQIDVDEGLARAADLVEATEHASHARAREPRAMRARPQVQAG